MTSSSDHHSFGIVPLRKREGQWEVLVIHRHQGFWEFPKGHAEEGEGSLTAAYRELEEETGLQVVRLLEEKPYTFSFYFLYHGHQTFKTVIYYLAEVSGQVLLQKEEVKESRWVPWKEVSDRLTYDNLKELVADMQAAESRWMAT